MNCSCWYRCEIHADNQYDNFYNCRVLQLMQEAKWLSRLQIDLPPAAQSILQQLSRSAYRLNVSHRQSMVSMYHTSNPCSQCISLSTESMVEMFSKWLNTWKTYVDIDDVSDYGILGIVLHLTICGLQKNFGIWSISDFPIFNPLDSNK